MEREPPKLAGEARGLDDYDGWARLWIFRGIVDLLSEIQMHKNQVLRPGL